MKRFTTVLLASGLVLTSVGALASMDRPADDRVHAPMPDQRDTVTRICLGSCFDPRDKVAWDIWDRVRELEPQLFLALGDNVYADTDDPEEYRAAFDLLETVPQYVRVREEIPVIATWDDHDYGFNDSGANFARQGSVTGYEDARRQSQDLFLDAYGVDEDSPRRAPRDGIYDAMILGPEGRRVQVIVLDTRYNRSDIEKDSTLRRADWVEGFPGSYVPHTDPSSTVLGEAQWEWLGEQLRKPAEARVIMTSVQFVADDHRFEKWGNFPHERARMIELIEETKANGVVFVSGDRHKGELSREDDAPYPLYDLTSSAMNHSNGRYWNEVNTRRDGALFASNNFGVLSFDWESPEPRITMELRDEGGRVVIRRHVPLRKLRVD